MTYKITKLTKQWNGYGHFKWVIQPARCSEVVARDLLSYWREWAWNTFGSGRELLWSIDDTPGAVWAFDTAHNNKRIYLKSDVELVLFQLKF